MLIIIRFPPPKIFTNALLGNHEITTLIRDTEPYERALFSLDPNATRSSSRSASARVNGVSTVDRGVHGRKSIYPTRPSIKQSAVARVLGPDMLREIQQSSGSAAKGKSGVNIEVLLQGAERLCEAYAVQGAPDKIAAIRKRHQQISTSVDDYQERVSIQQSKFERYQSGSGYGVDDHGNDLIDVADTLNSAPSYTEHDFQTEEAEIKDLEAKKKALEARVAGMEKDLGGLMA